MASRRRGHGTLSIDCATGDSDVFLMPPVPGPASDARINVADAIFSRISNEGLIRDAFTTLRYVNPARGWKWEVVMDRFAADRSGVIDEFHDSITRKYEEVGGKWIRSRMTIDYKREGGEEHLDICFQD